VAGQSLPSTERLNPAVLGVAGPDRAILYRVAAGTGFRANELRSITPESFDLDADPPTAIVEAAFSKHLITSTSYLMERRPCAEGLRPRGLRGLPNPCASTSRRRRPSHRPPTAAGHAQELVTTQMARQPQGLSSVPSGVYNL